MTEKELEKSLNKDVKPGQEQIAINTAQTQANQLLTEQRMNLQSERQMMTSNSERDTELRGAIELGAMNAAQPQQVVQQALPPQAAGLRPETQQLLAKYGVNPTITESARTTSNTSQSKSANSKMQVVPNPQTGGDTRVTNTTNITNITNNNSRVETKVDAKQPAVLPQAQPARLAPVTVAAGGVAAGGAMLGFKNFLNNLFAKRDHERQLQEREYRRRDWSIQRMSRKVLERMDSISQKFASKMNPEKVGSTFMGQIKLFLSMVGLTLLPKLWPAIIKGIDGISGFLSDIKTAWTSENGGIVSKLGSVFSVVGNKIVDGVMSLGGTIMGGLSGFVDRITAKLTDVLAGTDYDEAAKKAKGLAGIISDRLVEFFGGDPKNMNFLQMLENYFSNIFDKIENYINTMMEDRSAALSKAWNDSEFSMTDMEKNFSSLSKLLAAAVAGHKGLAAATGAAVKNEGKKLALQNVDTNFLGNIKSSEGVSQAISNIANAAVDSNDSNAHVIAEGNKKIYEYYKKNKDEAMTIDKSQFWSIVNRITDPATRSQIKTTLDNAVSTGKIKEESYSETISTPILGGTFAGSTIDTKSDNKLRYVVPKEYVPIVLTMMSGKSMSFDEAPMASEYLKNTYGRGYDSYLQGIDKIASINTTGGLDLGNAWHNFNEIIDAKNLLQFGWNAITGDIEGMKNSWQLKDAFKHGEETSALAQSGFTSYNEAAKEYSTEYDNLGRDFIDSTGVKWFWNEKLKKHIPGISGPTAEQKALYDRNWGTSYMYTRNTDLGTMANDAYNAVKEGVTSVADGLTGAADKAGNIVSTVVDYTANEAPMGVVAADNVAAGQTDSPLTGVTPWSGYAKKQTLAGVNPNVPDGTPTSQPQAETKAPERKWKTREEFRAEVDAGGHGILLNPNADEEAKEALVDDLMAKQLEEIKNSSVARLDDPSTTLHDRRKIVTQWVKDNLGLTEDQAIGVTAVMEYESAGLNPRAINEASNSYYPDNGLCQWCGKERNTNFLNWYKANYGDPGTARLPREFPAEVQLEFMKYEMSLRPKTWSQLKSAKDSTQAVDVFMRGFEAGGNGMTSIENFNNDYLKADSWKKLKDEKGILPYNKMFNDRIDKMMAVATTIKGNYTPTEQEINYIAQNERYSKAQLDSSKATDSGSGWYNELISFFESMFGDEPAAESANPAQADTGTSLGDTSTSMPSTPKAELADNQSTSVPTANVKGEVIPQSPPKTEIAKAPGAEELADNEPKTEAQAPVWAPTDASTHHTDNSQVVNNYNIVSDNALHSLTVHGRNLHSNHS